MDEFLPQNGGWVEDCSARIKIGRFHVETFFASLRECNLMMKRFPLPHRKEQFCSWFLQGIMLPPTIAELFRIQWCKSIHVERSLLETHHFQVPAVSFRECFATMVKIRDCCFPGQKSEVRAHCAKSGQAGFFLRTLCTGDIQDGDVLQLGNRKPLGVVLWNDGFSGAPDVFLGGDWTNGGRSLGFSRILAFYLLNGGTFPCLLLGFWGEGSGSAWRMPTKHKLASVRLIVSYSLL